MAATTHPTSKASDPQVRSVALAARGHTACSHAARTLGWTLDEDGALVSLALEVASAHGDAVYAVGYSAASDDASCDCRAAQFGQPCWHRGLAIVMGREVARLYAPAGRAATRREQALELDAEALAPSL